MRVLVLGASGMLGHKLILKFRARHEIMGTLRKPNERLTALMKGHESCLETGIDVFDLDKLKLLLKSFNPDVVINCIGIVKQLKEAHDPYISISVNALLPHQLEKLGMDYGFRLIHLSTDCVFSGRQGPYTENDVSDVSDLYGQTKYLGEVKGPNSLTLRTSIVGREINAPYNGLIEWFLAQDGAAEPIKGYTNALYTGITTNCMADVIDHILTNDHKIHGLYHLSTHEISKYELLNIVKEQAGINVKITPYGDFKCDRRLNGTKLKQEINWSAPSWPDMIKSMIAEDREFYKEVTKA